MQKPDVSITEYEKYVGVHHTYPKVKHLSELKLPGVSENGIAILPEELQQQLLVFWTMGYKAAQKDIREALGGT